MVTKGWRVGRGYNSRSDIHGRGRFASAGRGVPNCQLLERAARMAAARLAAEEVELSEGG